jgi:hypothetical protein
MGMDFLGRYSEKVASPLQAILVPGLIWSQLNSRHLGSGTLHRLHVDARLLGVA